MSNNNERIDIVSFFVRNSFTIDDAVKLFEDAVIKINVTHDDWADYFFDALKHCWASLEYHGVSINCFNELLVNSYNCFNNGEQAGVSVEAFIARLFIYKDIYSNDTVYDFSNYGGINNFMYDLTESLDDTELNEKLISVFGYQCLPLCYSLVNKVRNYNE
jgi:hypothetical protein